MKTKLLFPLLLLFSLNANAKKAPIKFGRIELSDLEMKIYEKDTSAPAVILCDYGYFNSTDMTFRRLVRIKILKKEGYNWANRVFPTSSKASIRGITYNLENGKIIKNKLSNKSIFSNRITEKYYNMRVAMPNVKVGSVMDLEFKHSWLPNEWEFQQTIPVIHSELIIESSEYFSFKKTYFGYEKLSISTDGYWVAENMPAFKEEPFINSANNYITKLEFTVSDISIPGYYYKSTRSWKDISKLLYDSEYFGIVIKSNKYLRTLAEIIERRKLSKLETIKSVFKEIRTIKWNEEDRLLTSSTNLKKIYNEKIGNSADINLALLQLLKLLKFEAEPVVLSTRENGIISPTGPNINKLNYVIVSVKLDGEILLLDASDEYLPYDILPKKCLNMAGQLVSRTSTEFIPIKSKKKDKEFASYSLKLDENLNITGNLDRRKFEYASYDFRKYFHSFNSKEEFLSELIKNKAGLKIMESKIDNIEDVNLPVTEKYNIKITNQFNQIGDEYYFNPMLFEQIKENPFKTKVRKYPVDYAYPKSKTVIMNLFIPKGFEVVELPKTVKMKLGNNDGVFTYQLNYANNTLSLRFNYSINKDIFLPLEYPDLKEFYNQIITKHAEPIILRKTDETKI